MSRAVVLALLVGLAALSSSEGAGDLFGALGTAKGSTGGSSAPAQAPVAGPAKAPARAPATAPTGSVTVPITSPKTPTPSTNISPKVSPSTGSVSIFPGMEESPSATSDLPIISNVPATTSTPSAAVWEGSTCSIGTGLSKRSVNCYAAEATSLASACGLASTSAGMIGFLGTFYSPFSDCNGPNADYGMSEYVSVFGFVGSLDECLCQCVIAEQCGAFTYEPDFTQAKEGANCFLFRTAPTNLYLCSSLYNGQSAEVD